jgi:hypothetical protein
MTFKGPAVLSSQDKKKIDPFCRWERNDKMPIDSGDRNRSRFIGSIRENLFVLPFSKRLCYPPVETRETFFRPVVDFLLFPNEGEIKQKAVRLNRQVHVRQR